MFYWRRIMTGIYQMNLVNLAVIQFNSYTVNHYDLATTLFRDLHDMNWFAATNFHDQPLSTPVFVVVAITCMLKILVQNEKYSRQWGYREQFSQANKSWFTVLYILMWDCIIKNQQTINSLLTLFHSFCFLIKREKFIPEPNSN